MLPRYGLRVLYHVYIQTFLSADYYYLTHTAIPARVPVEPTDADYHCETVLREAMQALVRVQAHMLARIVVEIRAAEIAVELEPQL